VCCKETAPLALVRARACVVALLLPLSAAMALEHTNVFRAEHALGRAVAKGFSPTSPRAHWIGPELCGQKEGSALVLLEGSAYGVSLADCSVFCALASTRPIAKISGQIPGPGKKGKWCANSGSVRAWARGGDCLRETPVDTLRIRLPIFFSRMHLGLP